MKNRLFHIVISLVIVGGIFLYFIRPFSQKPESNFFGATTQENSPGETDSNTEQTANAASRDASSNVPTHTYKNTTYKFSLEVPQNVNPSDFDDDGGHNVLIQDKAFGMQVYITPFDENIILTKERIQKDVPDLEMENPITITINGIAGVAFVSADGGQKYRQVWFVNKGHLYQTLSLVSYDTAIGEMLQSWKWL